MSLVIMTRVLTIAMLGMGLLALSQGGLALWIAGGLMVALGLVRAAVE